MTRGSSLVKVGEWTERLERFEQSGETVAEFCRQEGVSQPSFYQWRKKLAGSDVSTRRAVRNRRQSSRAGSAGKGGNPRPDSAAETASPACFRPVQLTAASTTGAQAARCLTVRLPGGIQLAMAGHLPVVERVVERLLEHAARQHAAAEAASTKRERPAC